MTKFPTAIKITGNNKIRFNKNYDKTISQEDLSHNKTERAMKAMTGTGKSILIRKYKIGELPDIQIATKDLLDPMLFLASQDNEFASELFILLFVRMCMTARK